MTQWLYNKLYSFAVTVIINYRSNSLKSFLFFFILKFNIFLQIIFKTLDLLGSYIQCHKIYDEYKVK